MIRGFSCVGKERLERWLGLTRLEAAIRRLLIITCITSLLVSMGPAGHAYRRPGTTELISVSSTGAQGDSESGQGAKLESVFSATPPSLSATGRYVAFVSSANNLVPDDNNILTPDVFVRDREKGTTELLTVSSDGIQAIPPVEIFGHVYSTAISENGRFVAFTSSAPNLVSGDTNVLPDVFVHDRKSGDTEFASIASGGEQANGQIGPAIGMSGDGRYVVFTSNADNLVDDDTNGSCGLLDLLKATGLISCGGWDVFVHDRKSGETERVSVSSDGTEQSGPRDTGYDALQGVGISRDGRDVVFASSSSTLVPNDADVCPHQIAVDIKGCEDIFVHDRRTGKTKRISIASDGTPGNGYSFLDGNGNQLISADNRYVIFGSWSSNLVPNDQEPYGSDADVFVHDLTTGRTRRASVMSDGHELTGCDQAAISAGGRHMTFTCSYWAMTGGNPPPPATSFGVTVVHDEHTGGLERTFVHPEAVDPQGRKCESAPDLIASLLDLIEDLVDPRTCKGSLHPAISDNGRLAVFVSPDERLVRGDDNASMDIFLRDVGLDVGVGGFLADDPPPDSPEGPDQICVLSVCVPPLDAPRANEDALIPGRADLVGGSIVSRSSTSDLLLRQDLRAMPSVLGKPVAEDAILFGFELVVDGKIFEVRAQRVPGPDFDRSGGASFALFEKDPRTDSYAKVATLHGGYGTTGEEIVVALPAALLGLDRGSSVTGAIAFTSLGTFETGPAKILDSLRLL